MCWVCVGEGFSSEEADAAVANPEVDRVARLIAAFYALPECGAGGPLHIVTDDTNVEDHSLDFCERELVNPDPVTSWHRMGNPAEVRRQGQAILTALRAMSECERAVATVVAFRYMVPS